MTKDKKRLVIKLFIALWIVLALHILLKLTFNYWQPYVIPNDTLQSISDFIDESQILKLSINKIFWTIGTYFMVLAGIQEWKFKEKYPIIAILICAVLSAIDNYYHLLDGIIDGIITIFILIILPLIINRKKWLTIILTFAFSYLFLFLSLWLEGFVSGDDMSHLTATFLVFDYYIMLILNYFVFNFIKKKEE